MSDDESADRKLTPEEAMEAWTKRLQNAEPVFQMYVEPPLTIGLTPAGELVVDFPGMGTMENLAAMVRLVVSPEAIRILGNALDIARKTQDERGGAPPPQSTH
jgi:hypothetical protein